MKKITWNSSHGRFRTNADNSSIETLQSGTKWQPVYFTVKENTFETRHDHVRKKLHCSTWSKQDFELYQELSHNKDYFMQVKEWKSPTLYTMEKLDVLGDVRTLLTDDPLDRSSQGASHFKDFSLTKDVLLDIYKVYNQFYLDCLALSRKYFDGEYFMHMDYQLQNVILTKDLQVKIIDADGFQKTNSFMDWKYFDGLQILMFLLVPKINELDKKSR